ncbi:hypothetical protein ERO13_D07G004700v2 [Gossypium hirsutum]|uniref:aldehyde dehydrogenase (NAD(+)) n=1 Tax=Gossypium hirsutum TaxID=3635 RepID=A0A1U8M4J8_GOSHI|nr:aldehyde dehydrogenase family 2 member C4 [Gossypium hirsutum]KAG4136424.1 hypothetical protein ERO13_D07G004700v2 [Gossypium hirsutum]
MADHCNGSSHSSESFANIPPIKFTKLFINGNFVDSVSGKTFEAIDPRTGEAITLVSKGDKEDVDLAVKAARFAFDNGPWPRLSGSERGRILMKLADLIEENIEEIASLDAINGGKLFSLCKLIDIPAASMALRYYAGAADKIHGTVLKLSKGLQGYTLREPIGVVGAIIPWNFPTIMFFMKVAPALAAGCTIVVKPAEQTPLSALYYAHLAKLAGVPDGVLNVVNGYGETAGAAISSHMDIDKTDKKQFEKILSYIEHGKREGATLLTGGKHIGQKGYYIQPTIFADVKDDMIVAKNEIFGPVMSLMKFKTMEEGIKRANNTTYGLAAGVITKDLNVANTVSRSVRAGIVWINCYAVFDMDCPYGGYKMSGFGRDYGLDALNQYLQIKSVVTPIHDSPWH